MNYTQFLIRNYRAIKGPLKVDLNNNIIPLVGINECGKTTVLQAIFAFDKANDELNKSKQIQNIGNLYILEDEDCEITATVNIKKKEFIDIVNELISENDSEIIKNNAKKETIDENSEEFNNLNTYNDNYNNENILYNKIVKILEDKEEEIINVDIKRNLYENEPSKYSVLNAKLKKIDSFETVTEKLANKIVEKLPPILYSDDFNDRPDGEVEITKEGNKTEWERIYSRVFNAALSKQDFSIYTLFDEDSRRRKSILSDVSKYLSDNLTEAWSRFSSEKRKITISFDLDEKNENDQQKRILQINIIENVNGQDRVFGVSDRSKGFIWYYNFIMKIQFNPKQNINGKTVFLLDEPGSYLHETAQNELCKKLVEISEDEGIVIYCTHSPQLLNPQYIPLSTINIVTKKQSTIKCSPISSYKTSTTKITAFQPIYEALQIPEFKSIEKDQKIIAGEGIYDKYVMEMFCELPKNVITFGSADAKSLHDNIQYFIAFSIKYMAIWDNDSEGNTFYNKARNDFGELESNNFYLLPNLHSKPKVRMEEMFEEEDMILINEVLGLKKDSSYTLAMSSLYYSKDRDKKLSKIKSKLSKKCSDNFANLSNTIKKHFE